MKKKKNNQGHDKMTRSQTRIKKLQSRVSLIEGYLEKCNSIQNNIKLMKEFKKQIFPSLLKVDKIIKELQELKKNTKKELSSLQKIRKRVRFSKEEPTVYYVQTHYRTPYV